MSLIERSTVCLLQCRGMDAYVGQEAVSHATLTCSKLVDTDVRMHVLIHTYPSVVQHCTGSIYVCARVHTFSA